jgi:isoleucyl-tRNA synthetase
MSPSKEETASYKETLNLPSTDFAMKADLVKREPQIRQKWGEISLYEEIRSRRKGASKYILHDGPPYANGDVHIGTGLNKILKDIVVKFKTMRGFDSPFIPGWDCHGLPIERQVMEELGAALRRMSKMEVRSRCRAHAEKFIKIQREQFKSLGVTGDWERPYLTLSPGYEARVLDVLADLVAAGYIYRSKKPIHWCMNCKTVLAEAELEYDMEPSPSIYVKFPAEEGIKEAFGYQGDEPAYILIWTTTPWTLPANMAIAIHPRAKYSLVRAASGKDGAPELLFLAKELIPTVVDEVGLGDYEIVGEVQGRQMEGKKYRHPFMGRTSPVILADFVGLAEGTGCVHSSPGHGQDDYVACRKYDIDILSPVDEDGVFTQEAGPFAREYVYDANPKIIEHLRKSGHLLYSSEMEHSYPHCWRCRKPVIFRATEQWFVNVDHKGLRQQALEEIAHTRWVPDWGEVRISSMVSERPDWCISRQKAWGVPIPALYCKNCGEVLLTKKTILAARDLFAREGSNSWFEKDVKEIFPEDTACPKCGKKDFRKETDILDVWFESGASYRTVLMDSEELAFPSDLYLEGTDQHRGWFQLALLLSVGAEKKAPFKTVLTHGFVVDEKGYKMSKSLGNIFNAQDAVKEHGADVCRLWLSSVDYKEDISVSLPIIRRMREAYRRIRNTFRYLLGNLYDFDPEKDALPYGELLEIDRWALLGLERLVAAVTQAYENFEFHRVYHSVHNFCVVEMSNFYLDVLKDRLYTFAREGEGRRSAQTALYEILTALTRLIAPILVHTADEVWSHIPGAQDELPSVHLAEWPQVKEEYLDEALEAHWQRLFQVRSEVTRALERAREKRLIGNALEAVVTLFTGKDDDLYEFLSGYEKELPAIFIVSEVEIKKGAQEEALAAEALEELKIKVVRSPHKKCTRCWNYAPSVGQSEAHPGLCHRCLEVVQSA